MVIHPRPHTPRLPGLCSWSQAVGGGGHYNCSHCLPKELSEAQVVEKGREELGSTLQGEGSVGRGEPALAESQLCLTLEPTKVELCSKFWEPLEHPWKGQSHWTGMKVALPDCPP